MLCLLCRAWVRRDGRKQGDEFDGLWRYQVKIKVLRTRQQWEGEGEEGSRTRFWLRCGR